MLLQSDARSIKMFFKEHNSKVNIPLVTEQRAGLVAADRARRRNEVRPFVAVRQRFALNPAWIKIVSSPNETIVEIISPFACTFKIPFH
jgi:hypothetical protein